MAKRAFSIEDGVLNSGTLVTARNRVFKDIDLSIAKKPSGDIFKKQDAAAVKQSVKNILLTNRNEKPFTPNFGGDLNSFLFSLDTEFDLDLLEQRIIDSIDTYEPRAKVLNVDFRMTPDSYTVYVKVTFKVVNISEIETIDLTLTRLR